MLEKFTSLGWVCRVREKKYLSFLKRPDKIMKDEKEVIKKKGQDRYLQSLKSTRPGTPMELIVIFEEMDDGIKLSVTCLPTMYYQVQQIGRDKFSIFYIKSAVLECKDFMSEIFIGRLDCKSQIPPHPNKPLKQKSYEFLANFKTRDLSEKIKSALKTAGREIYLSGWIGQVVVPLLQEAKRKGVRINIITKTPAKDTKGYRDKVEAINRLKEFLEKDDVMLVPTCHSRMLIIDDNNIFVGSMDMDSESFDQREECAIWSDDPNLVVKGKICFAEIFKKGKKLS